MAGRRPKSLALKLVTGNPGKRKLRTDEPQANPGWPDQPAWLGKIAREEWDRLARELEREQRLTTADGSMLTAAASAYEAWLDVLKMQRGRGVPPDLKLRMKSAARMERDNYRKCLNDLCLSQGTRARARTIAGKPKSRLEAFLGGKGRA